MSDDAFFQHLRSKTSSAHKQLENTYPFSTLMRPEAFNVRSYAAVLRIMGAFHNAYSKMSIGSTTNSICELLMPLETTTAIETDLHIMRGSSVKICPLNNHKYDYSMNEFLAYAYVWSGSSMGAQILIKWLQRQTQVSVPTHYYQQMAKSAVSWPTVKTFISEWVRTSGVNAESIAEHAVNWFDAIISHANYEIDYERKSVAKLASL
jgi:heme oxygenase